MRVDASESLSWDVFCRVIDNHGDLGVCLRLARELAQAGQRVRLWVDDPSALTWMAPELTIAPLVEVHSAGPPGTLRVHRFDDAARAESSDVVIEAFGCDPPGAFVERLPRPPAVQRVWINLEYLSAERYVERSHGLPSPQHSGPGAGLIKWFFYPGFTAKTGGLLDRLPPANLDMDPSAERSDWLTARGVRARQDARWISLFCYRQAVLSFFLDSVADDAAWPAVDLLVAPGLPLDTVNDWLAQRRLPRLRAPAAGHFGEPVEIGKARLYALPYLPQRDHDGLLMRCDLNFVRGEDSWVTGLRAGRPLLWQAYLQHDQVHVAKLAAFLDLYLASAPAELRATSAAAHRLWNGLVPPDQTGTTAQSLSNAVRQLLAATADQHARLFAAQLRLQPDLLTQLRDFVEDRRRRSTGSATS